MKFYRGTTEIYDIVLDDKTIYKDTLLGEELISCVFSLDVMLELKIGDYVYWRNKKYSILKEPSIRKEKGDLFAYNFNLESEKYKFNDGLYMLDANADFFLMGDLESFATLLVENLNRIKGSEYYSLGSIVQTETKNLSFKDQYCLEALQYIIDEFGIKYSISDDGKTINFSEELSSYTGLKYEYGYGLKNIERKKLNNRPLVTRLYAFGSERNISNDYGSKKLKISPLEKNILQFGVKEGVVNFEEVYPKREGTVSSIDNSDEKKIIDSTIDFNFNDQLLPGVTGKIIFNSGDLAGYEFEVENYNDTTKEFILIPYEDENGNIFPNNTIKPQVNDKYVLHDIKMPQSYIDSAELLLTQKAQKYLDENSIPNVIYSIEPDDKYLRRHLITLNVGDIVNIVDEDFNISFDTKIISLTQSITNPYLYTIQVGDKVTVSLLKDIKDNQGDLSRDIRKETDNRKISNNRIRKSLKNIDELKNAVFDTEGYFDAEKIKPLSIETKMLSVGSKSEQFIVRGLLIQPNYTSNKNTTKIEDCVLTHFTIEESIKEWNLTGGIKNHSSDSSFYYIYARCDRSGTTGDFLCTSTQYQVDSGSTYYYFLIGVIHSVVDGVRGISMTYGQTTINGKFITTGRIQSGDGQQYIDLLQDKIDIHAKVSFTDDSPAKQYIDNELDNYSAIVDAAIADVQNQVDGNITSWFYSHVPTTSNLPASDWDTTEKKNNHLGDLFYNNVTGYAYRYILDNSVYSWFQITDSDITTALANAQTAQDTADNKRRVFVTQPTTPYNIGDLWAEGSSSGLKKCKVERLSGSYNSNDWENATKYDDNISDIEDKTTFLSTDINGNVIATGTLLVGADATTKGGITGIGGPSGIGFWLGEVFANRDSAPIRMYRNGDFVFKKVDNTNGGIEMDSINQRFVVYHPNGVAGIVMKLESGTPVLRFYEDDASEVFYLDKRGISYVKTIPESYTAIDLRLLSSVYGSSPSPAEIDVMNDDITANSSWVDYSVNNTIAGYIYDAGRNINTSSNEQYNGYKNTQLKTDNITDGWYVVAGIPLDEVQGTNYLSATLLYIVSGVVENTIGLSNIDKPVHP